MDNTGAEDGALVATASLAGYCIDYRIQKAQTHYDLYVRASDGSQICIPGFTRDAAYAKALLKLLSENAVFPQNITEVMDDLLANDTALN